MEKGEPIVVVKEVGKNYGTVEALKKFLSLWNGEKSLV